LRRAPGENHFATAGVGGAKRAARFLISDLLPGLLDVLHLGDGYGHLAANLPSAIARSALCAILILLVSTGLNQIGFRLKL